LNILPRQWQYPLRFTYGLLPARLRYGRPFTETRCLLRKSQWWSRERIEQYQLDRIRGLLSHANAHVPYYRMLFRKHDLNAAEIHTFDEFSRIPFLTRDLIKANRDLLCADCYAQSRLAKTTTGGSSGIPLSFYREKGYSNAVDFAFMTALWGRVGYRLNDRCAILRGAVVQAAEQGKCWEFRPDVNALFLSSYDLTDENMALYVQLMHRYRPLFIRAYPSALAILANFMRREALCPPSGLKAVLCGSEPLYPHQRSLFAQLFQCRVFSWYGHSEYAVLAGECECSNVYHVFPEYGYCELIDSQGCPVTEEGGRGEIVATSFHNRAFPFIRYRTGDVGVRTNRACACGRQYPLIKEVEGRLQEYVLTKDQRWVTLTALVFAQHFEAFSRIRKMQLEQFRAGEVTVRIARCPGFREIDASEIVRKIRAAVNNQLDVRVAYVDDLSSTHAGKHRFLLQHLPVPALGKNCAE